MAEKKIYMAGFNFQRSVSDNEPAITTKPSVRELPNINIPNLLAFLVVFFVVSTVT